MDPVKLQMDIRNNQSDLESFVNDLNDWTDEMKHKETKPLDSKQTSAGAAAAKTKTPGAPSSTRTMSAHTVSEDVRLLKESGNAFLKKSQYSKAVKQYTAAMDLDATYAVLPANRAWAHIKMQNYKAAEQDCDRAIQLDSSYVKAYLRRANARSELQNVKGACDDFRTVLRLEPNNVEAKSALSKLEVHLKQSPVISDLVSTADNCSSSVNKSQDARPVDSAGKSEKSACKRTRDSSARQKLSKQASSSNATKSSNNTLKDIKIQHFSNDTQLDHYIKSVLPQGTQLPTSLVSDSGQLAAQGSTVANGSREINGSGSAQSSDTSVTTDSRSSRGEKVQCDQTGPIAGENLDAAPRSLDGHHSPQLVVEQAEKTIKPESARCSYTDASSGKAIEVCAPEVRPSPSSNSSSSTETTPAESVVSSIKERQSGNGSGDAVSKATFSDRPSPASTNQSVLSPPTSSYQLLSDWRLLKSSRPNLADYLKSIDPGRYVDIFRESLDARLLVDFLACMEIWKESEAAPRLNALSKVRRIDTMVMFLEKDVRKRLVDLLDRCGASGHDMSPASRFRQLC